MAKSNFGTVGPQVIRSYTADVDLTAGLAVMAGAAANSVKLPTAANVRVLGVTAAASRSGSTDKVVSVVEFGEVVGVADASITRGAWVMANATTGKIAPVGASAGTNYEAIGIALEAASAQDDEFLLFVCPSRAQG